MKHAIPPMYECRNDMDIFADLAVRLGIDDHHEKTEAGDECVPMIHAIALQMC
jgi:anaerobic selenocysteine-containing dehydrogenase